MKMCYVELGCETLCLIRDCDLDKDLGMIESRGVHVSKVQGQILSAKNRRRFAVREVYPEPKAQPMRTGAGKPGGSTDISLV